MRNFKLKSKIELELAKRLNRHERRHLGKVNGITIVGTNKPTTKPVKR